MARRVLGNDEILFNVLMTLDTYLGRPRVSSLLSGVRERNLQRLLARAAEAQKTLPPEPEIPVRVDVTPEEFQRDYLEASRPIVLKGFAKSFPAVGRWSPEFFRDTFGDMRIQAVDGQGWAVEDSESGEADVAVREMTLREQVDRMLSGGSDYVSFWTELFTRHPELGKDIDVPALNKFIEPPRWTPDPIFKFFMGAGGTSTQWHCAELQNLFVQIHGTKEWRMCPPYWTPCMDPRVVSLQQQYCHGMVDFRDPDIERYPLYAYAPQRRVVLEPGDVLYVPPFWWHCVMNPEVSIGLAVWWINLVPAARSHFTLFWLTVMSPQHIFRQVMERVQGKDHRTAVTASSIFKSHGVEVEKTDR